MWIKLPIFNLLLCNALELMLHMAVAHAPSADEHSIRGGTNPPKVRMELAQQVLGALKADCACQMHYLASSFSLY